MFVFSNLIQKSFWIKVWVWCKVNWKFLLGLIIPIALSIFLRRGRASEILAKGRELKSKQMEAELEAYKLKISLEEKAREEHAAAIENANQVHDESVKELEKNLSEIEADINSPEKATEALSQKFKLNNLDDE